MDKLNTILPLISASVSFLFAFFIIRRYLQRKGMHLLIWAIGMLFYGIGGLCEGLFGLLGWSELVFRVWYLVGAILVAAWLGQGTIYLLMKPSTAHILMILLLAGSTFAAVRVFSAELDPSLMSSSAHTGSELSGHAIVTPGIRTLTPLFNAYGTLALVGGAIWSAWIFWRKRVLLHRTLGNVLIAAGAMAPAFGGAFSRFGIPGILYILELIGAVLLFAGFLRATTPMAVPSQTPLPAGKQTG